MCSSFQYTPRLLKTQIQNEINLGAECVPYFASEPCQILALQALALIKS